MNVTVSEGNVYEQEASLAAKGFCEGEPLDEALSRFIEVEDFKGKSKQTALFYPRGALPARRVLLVGLGKHEKLQTNTIRQAAAKICKVAHQLQLADVAMQLPIPQGVTTEAAVQAMVEGAELGLYRYLKHKSEQQPEESHQVSQLTIVVTGDREGAQRGANIGQVIAQGVLLARDLANMPPNMLYPEQLGVIATEIGQQVGFRTTVLDQEAMEAQGFGGILAVGQGSHRPPRFIILEYNEASPHHPTICLVGKGITFDTGGISIKPSDKMDQMKYDMSGAAAVLATVQIAAQLNLPLHVVGLISAAENMPDGKAYRPGDIIKTLSGKTIEVLNTDAEGRIILADALFYAQRYQPAAIIDIATLTAAIIVALGPHAIGLMSNNQALADRIIAAGQATFERVWQLPLWEEYHEMMKSKIADLRNVWNREAGSITAAAFLAAFVGEYPWAHLDIAGTAWTESPKLEYLSEGVTGVGVRLLSEVLRTWQS